MKNNKSNRNNNTNETEMEECIGIMSRTRRISLFNLNSRIKIVH